LFGGWQESFITSTTSASPAVFVLALIVHGSALALVLWQAKRHRIQWLYQPSTQAPYPIEGSPPAPVLGWQSR
jgi:hypothetical protein